MVCVCCVSLPQVSLVLGTTAAATVGGSRFLHRKRRVSSCVSHSFALLLLLLSFILALLDNHDGLRKLAFAKLCQKLASSEGMDDLRCNKLGLREVGGVVIEFGPGPGTNFRCWGAEDAAHTGRIQRWVGVEPNDEFGAMQESEALKRNATYFPRENAWLRGEDVAVETGTFDTAVRNRRSLTHTHTHSAVLSLQCVRRTAFSQVLTHVLCSVSDPAAVLRQAAAALKPGGKIFVLEHVAAVEGTANWYAQQLVAPIFYIVANGCTFRDVATLLRADTSGFDPFVVEEVDAPMPIPVTRPHVIATSLKKNK